MTGGRLTVREIADELLRELAPYDVVAAQARGEQPANLMPRLAPADFDSRHNAMVRALRRLDETAPTASASASASASADTVLAAALRERLGSDIALDDVGFTTALLAPLATPVHAVRQVFDTLPADDWDAIEAHLRLVPAALEDYRETLRNAPRVVAARQVRGAAEQCEKWVDPARDDFYRRLVAARPDLRRLADQASEATEQFAAFLRTELLPCAPQRDAVGRELYTVTARAFLGDDVDLDETYRFGWDELRELTAEMTGVARRLGHDSVEAAAAALDAEPARTLRSDELADWLQGRVEDVVRDVDGVVLDLPPQARMPECALSPTAAGVMYYAPPDAAFTRPGRIWWSPPASGQTYSWREVTTVHHEGVPGHHLQIATALADPDLHPWQRAMAHVHGYAEGWAHYAERLADELGLLRDEGERLGMLYGQRWRAARIVIDMGLHLGLPIPPGNGITEATEWTPELGVAVLQYAGGMDETTARFEVDRYLGWPAQALSFRVGARLWRGLREAAAARPGFDLREFHMRALRTGPMGLAPLRDALEPSSC